MDNTRRKPNVFVSSTCYDLKQIRNDLKDFFEDNYGFQTMLSEFESFPIDPCKGTFENCIENVDKHADIFILIVGNRYGYITNQGKSITNLEYLHAKEKGIPVYVFVDKQLYDNMKIWRRNKEADFSSIVDNSKIFEFVSDIYDESQQWIYTYDSVKDIEIVLKQQLSLIFFDGLILRKAVQSSYNDIINGDISSEAVRVFVEKPYAWEYKFLACVLKNEFDKLQSKRWDFQYGISLARPVNFKDIEFIDNISIKLGEIGALINTLDLLINSALQDAIGNPGVPSDLDMMIYVSKQIASVYRQMIEWGLYFKTINADVKYEKVLYLLYQLPASVMKQIDELVEQIYNDVMGIPDVADEIERELTFSCDLDFENIDKIYTEIEKISIDY